ncbi:MAG: hypothetical protein MI865_12250, partial [Proteobacteria bacterium]|nr:hypothetical protein [Pseudomonadota bacterium]
MRDGELVLSQGVTPYDIATPLFSDYALKLRTVWMPNGTAAKYHSQNAFDFPIGTVITKTFYYETEGEIVRAGEPPSLSTKSMPLNRYRLIETRLLVKRESGWAAFPYVWNEDQTDATLKRT